MTGITAADDILYARGPLVRAVEAAFDKAIETIRAKTTTQLGLAADYVTYT
jgi:hypothetical protein